MSIVEYLNRSQMVNILCSWPISYSGFMQRKKKHKQIFECNSNLMKSTLLNFEVEGTQNNFSQVVFQ